MASRTIDKYPTPGRGFLTNPHHHNLQDDKCPGGWACLELTEPLPYLSVKIIHTYRQQVMWSLLLRLKPCLDIRVKGCGYK